MPSSNVMMSLGNFLFSISTAAYDELERTSAYKWGDQNVVDGNTVLQFTGRDAETISLHCVLYPGAPYTQNALLQVTTLRDMAERGTAYLLVSGTGKNFGEWVIERISEKTSVHFADGTPRKIVFTLNLKEYKRP